MSFNQAYTVALSGGLGNQMFQYAMGRSLALRNDAQLLLDTRLLDADPLRQFALGGFEIVAPIASAGQLPPPVGRVARRLNSLTRRWPVGRYVLEREFTFDPDALKRRPPAHIYGNWQTERYFTDFESIIRSDFRLSAPFTAARQSILEIITNRDSVSVHVRRGDYVSNPVANAFHGTCTPKWYSEAKLAIEGRVANPTYVVFSDDVDWARSNLRDFANAAFVNPSSDGKDEQDLALMACCRHHIIANSSFSWWGAWLNPRPDKLVIAPSQWFGGAKLDTRDLIPSRWIRL